MDASAIARLVLPDAWFIAVESSALAKSPVSVTVQNVPLVLFRDGQGKAVALVDRCPHRNVPLSLGRVREGCLECPYHGWRFGDAGACLRVPGLMDEGETSLKARAATAHPTREAQGYVWVSATPDAPTRPPFEFPSLDAPGFTTVRRTFTVEGSMHAVLENTLDVPHTGFLHGGLFRTADKKNDIEVVVRRLSDRAEAQYLGEPAPRGLAGRLLAPSGGTVEHTDSFILPSAAQVEYRLGTSVLYSTAVMTPVSAYQTRVFAVVTFRTVVPGFLVAPFVAPVALRIFSQDARILAAQTKTIAAFGGERFTSTTLDALGPQILFLLKEASKGAEADAVTPPREYRFRMKT